MAVDTILAEEILYYLFVTCYVHFTRKDLVERNKLIILQYVFFVPSCSYVQSTRSSYAPLSRGGVSDLI